MLSVFYPDDRISARYDIKGCEVSRWTQPAPEGSGHVVVLKDLNFEGQYITLGKEGRSTAHPDTALSTGVSLLPFFTVSDSSVFCLYPGGVSPVCVLSMCLLPIHVLSLCPLCLCVSCLWPGCMPPVCVLSVCVPPVCVLAVCVSPVYPCPVCLCPGCVSPFYPCPVLPIRDLSVCQLSVSGLCPGCVSSFYQCHVLSIHVLTMCLLSVSYLSVCRLSIPVLYIRVLSVSSVCRLSIPVLYIRVMSVSWLCFSFLSMSCPVYPCPVCVSCLCVLSVSCLCVACLSLPCISMSCLCPVCVSPVYPCPVHPCPVYPCPVCVSCLCPACAAQQRSWLLLQVDIDTRFLQRLNVLDYSFLLAQQPLQPDEQLQVLSLRTLIIRTKRSVGSSTDPHFSAPVCVLTG
uniref:PIPK domain-containing protein n=1 Tax=Takifugu rubripes TaxID=31033 RepID=A0A674MQ01_TAKRU